MPVPQPAAKKYVFTYTDDVARSPNVQDQEHPVKSKLSWHNPLIGVSNYGIDSLQFISFDGTRSAFDSSDCKFRTWTDYIIPQGKQIRKVETLLSKNEGYLYGFKWIGDDGAVLLAFGDIDDPD